MVFAGIISGKDRSVLIASFSISGENPFTSIFSIFPLLEILNLV